MKDAVFGIHLIEFQAACFGHAQAVQEHAQQQAMVAGLVAAAVDRLKQASHLARGKILALAVEQHGATVLARPMHILPLVSRTSLDATALPGSLETLARAG